MSASSFLFMLIGSIIGQFLARGLIDYFDCKDNSEDEDDEEVEEE